jgi:acetyl-CoA/propionyl-CoA carboxylase biotin carboxyl carrier protein
VYAEDPARGFLPATGTVAALRWPRGEGVRVDAGVEAGREVTSRYDPMLAKVVAHAPTREEAIERLDAALADTTLLGLRTNVAFLREVLADEGIRAGEMDTTLLERRDPAPPDPAAAERAALVAELAAALERRAAAQPGDPFTALAGWRVSGTPAAHHARLRVDGEHDVELAVPPPDDGLVRELPDGRLGVTLDGEASAWSVARDGASTWVGTDGSSWLVAPGTRALRGAEADGDSALRAPMPGSVIAVALEEGAEVARGDVVCVLESMKMELSITAPIDGTLAELRVAAGDQVKLDEHLATVHPKEAPAG